MRYFLLFLSLFFVMYSCGSKSTGSKTCSDNSGCETGEACFYGSCFKEGDRAMGIKTVQIVGAAKLNLVDGDITPLRVQVVLAPTNEMKEKFSEEDLKKIVGPIEGETINFKFNAEGLESQLSVNNAVSDPTGMAAINLSAVNSTSREITFNVATYTNNCNPQDGCYRNYIVKVDKRSKSLEILSANPLEFFTNSKRTLIAKVSTNNNLPFPEQNVKFTINGGNGSTLEDLSSGSSGTELTVKSDFAGVARVSLNSGENEASFSVNVESAGTASKSINVIVSKRVDGGCLTQDDCASFGESYECQNSVCVFVPTPCSDDADCPDKFECKNNICVEKPYICGEGEYVPIEECRCVTDLNCPAAHQCVRGRCVEQNIACTENIDCPNGLICRDGTCQPNHTECKMDANCYMFYGPDNTMGNEVKCPNEDSCICREGLCVNPCPDTEYIELSGGSGSSCNNDSQCAENEVCFTAYNVNKCIAKWDADYYFHLITALPPVLQDILGGIGRVFGPVSDILVGDDIDWGLPGWLSWLEESIVAAVRPIIDQYVPAWAQDLIVGLNDTIEILQEMKVKVRMGLIHDTVQHSSIKGVETWDAFYVEWRGQWTEVRPTEENFQLNSSHFTGSIGCEIKNDNPVYSLYIDEHPAEFYFGRFVTAFLDGVLIPAVTSGQAHSLGEAVRLYVDCRSIAEVVVDTVKNVVGDFLGSIVGSLITVNTFEGLCNTGVTVLVNKVNDLINQLHFGDAQGGSDSFKFGGYAIIEQSAQQAKKLKEGKYTGTLKLGIERSFTADWDAEKAR